MSEGEICNCPKPRHPELPGGKTGCRRYSADQELGGLCSSCAMGWHLPCDRPRFTPGDCGVCGWHGSVHREPEGGR